MKNFCREILNKAAAVFSVAALAVLVSVSSCGDTDDPDVLTVGVAFPLSGEAQTIGERMKKAVKLAVEEINGSSLLGGTELRLIFEDPGSTSDGAEKAFRKLIDEHSVGAIIGPWSSSSTKSTAPIANRSGVVVISPTSAASPDGITAPGDFIFRTSLTVDKLVPEGIRKTKNLLNYSRAATIVNEADTFSVSSNEEILSELKKQDVEIVAEHTFRREKNDLVLPDLSEQLGAIKDSGADAVFVSATSRGRSGVIIKARKMGITAPLIVTLLTVTDVKTAEEDFKGSTEGVYAFTSWVADSTPRSMDFVSSYRMKYGGEIPDAYPAQAYAAAYVLAAGVARASTDSSEDIRAALQMIGPENALDTIFGKFHFDANGDAVYSPIVVEVRNGEFNVLQ